MNPLLTVFKKFYFSQSIILVHEFQCYLCLESYDVYDEEFDD